MNAKANSYQTLYQPHTAPNMCLSAILHSSSSLPTVNPIGLAPVIKQICTVLFAARDKYVKPLMELISKIIVNGSFIKIMQPFFLLWETNLLIL